MQKISRIAGFTLIEVLVSVMLSGIILTAAYSAFQGIMKSQVKLGGTISIQSNLFYLNEKLAKLIHEGGTIDYEEYFNRRILGYDRGPSPLTDTAPLFTFTTASKYGNGSSTLYFCGMANQSPDSDDGCLTSVSATKTGSFGPNLSGQTMYGQYQNLAFNYYTSLPTQIRLPSIFPASGASIDIGESGLPELYLIKKLPDGSSERVYFRHVFVEDPESKISSPSAHTCNPTSPNLDNCLGKIQMTRMKSCDVHKADGSDGSDGIIDFWIPTDDFSTTPGLTCAGLKNTISAATDSLEWVDLSSPEMNITKAQFLPSPTKIPGLMSGAGEINATSPTVQLHLEVRLSEGVIRRGLLKGDANTPRVLVTTFDLSDN